MNARVKMSRDEEDAQNTEQKRETKEKTQDV